MDLFEKLTAKRQQRERASIDNFHALVRAVASGQEPDADQAERILSDSGRSLDDLRTAVELYQRRVAMRAQLDSLPKLEAERKEIERQLAEADAALSAAEQRHMEVTVPLRSRLEQLQLATIEAERCRQQLVETCPDEELRQRLADLQRQLEEAGNRTIKLQQEINRHKTWVQVYQAEAAYTRPSQQQPAQRQAGQHEAEVRVKEKELAEARKRAAALAKEIEAIRARMLEP
jgi:chromosome segregation ATPase